MHIKKVVLKGFKSYLQASNAEDFSPRVNAIVGVNGSGKSNFFEAIRFVLSESLNNLRAEERQQLLFERAGQPAFEAQVAIHFDNSDGRFPVDSEEVILRRIIGRSKEGYYCINDKRVTKQEVINLLESAGFSRSNPYYIVQQGKVNDLTLMKDKERLELLKEVAGTRVYEEKKVESLKLIREGDSKGEKCKDLLKYIDERLSELETEKEELVKFETLDKQKRSIEYNLYEKQLRDSEKNLEKLEETRQEEMQTVDEAHEAANTNQNKIKEQERKMKKIGAELQQLIKEKESVDEERQELIQVKAKLELESYDKEKNIKNQEENNEQLQNELNKLLKEIEKVQKKLKEKTDQYDKALEEERITTERLSTCETKLNSLYSKLGRSAQYSSKEERDSSIKSELKQLSEVVAAKNKLVKDTEGEIEQLDTQINDKTTLRTEKEEKLNQIKQTLDDQMKTCTKLRNQRDSLANERKEKWREDAEFEEKIKTLKEEKVMQERGLYSTIDRATYQGLQSINKIVEDNKIEGYYGPLIQLFKCAESVQTAVEVTAGSSLFYVVVNTEETASKIITIMNKQRSGRVTFIPLNRVSARASSRSDLPKTNDYFPLIDVLTFAPMFEPAMYQVFGRTLLCINLEVATSFARTQNLDCVTKQGDKVNKRGALTGGYYDVRVSRCQSMKIINTVNDKLENLQAQSDKIKKEIASKDKQINDILAQLQSQEGKLQSMQNTIEQSNFETWTLAKETRGHESIINQRRKTLSDTRSELEQLDITVNQLKEELKTPFHSQLSSDEKKEVKNLNEEIVKIQQVYIEQSKKRGQIEADKNQLENQLNSNLLKRQEELQNLISPSKLTDLQSTFSKTKSEFAQIKQAADIANKRFEETEEAIFQRTESLNKLRNSIEDLKKEEYNHKEQIQNKSKYVENYFNKKSLLLQQKEEFSRKIRELGSVPSGYEKYENYTIPKLMKTLHTTNEQLRKYSHVNKKAFDQWKSFTKQKKELHSRMDDLKDSKDAIQALIETLDRQKDEAICLTLKGVSARFAESFQQLVPHGRAELSVVIGSGSDSENEETESEDEEEEGDKEDSPSAISKQVRRYQGVAIEASFSDAEPLPVELLSGGQKAVTALALIFAIQKCDPAPFYLFDEIDSALDPIYRTAVGKMISEQAASETNGAQFLISTFKPELLESAEKFFGITMKDKASHLNTITKQDAKDFIEEDVDADEESEDKMED